MLLYFKFQILAVCCWPVGKWLALNSATFICCFLVSGEVGRGVCACLCVYVCAHSFGFLHRFFFPFSCLTALSRISSVILRRNDGRGILPSFSPLRDISCSCSSDVFIELRNVPSTTLIDGIFFFNFWCRWYTSDFWYWSGFLHLGSLTWLWCGILSYITNPDLLTLLRLSAICCCKRGWCEVSSSVTSVWFG